VLDGFEIKNMYWTGAPAYGNAVGIAISTSTHVRVRNCYFHSWSHDTLANGTLDRLKLIVGDTNPPFNNGSVIENCEFDGHPNGVDSGMATYAVPTVLNCHAHDMSNGILVSNDVTVSGCRIHDINKSFDPACHENGIESTGSGNQRIFNNVLYNTCAIVIFVGGAPVCEVFNNVIYNPRTEPLQPIPIQIDTHKPRVGGTVYIYNNTLVSRVGATVRIAERNEGSIKKLVLKNNLFITGVKDPAQYQLAGGSRTFPKAQAIGTTEEVSVSNNLILKPEEAEAKGYMIKNEYRPTGSSSPTVGAGINLGKEAEFRFHGLDIGGKSRGEKWDIGAYQYGADGGETKNPK